MQTYPHRTTVSEFFPVTDIRSFQHQARISNKDLPEYLPAD